jgi:hypothetical protein
MDWAGASCALSLVPGCSQFGLLQATLHLCVGRTAALPAPPLSTVWGKPASNPSPLWLGRGAGKSPPALQSKASSAPSIPSLPGALQGQAPNTRQAPHCCRAGEEGLQRRDAPGMKRGWKDSFRARHEFRGWLRMPPHRRKDDGNWGAGHGSVRGRGMSRPRSKRGG